MSTSGSSVSVVGQIYIRIVEARNIKSSDPFVKLFLDGQKKDSLKTKVSGKQHYPEWHQEFLLTCSSPTSTITFSIYDHKSILKDVRLGTAILKLQELSGSTLHDIWLPLDSQGDLRVLVHFTPLSPHPRKAHIQHTFSQLRIVLNGNVFYPGSEVYGAVVCGVHKTKKIRGLHLHALGRTTTFWTTGSTLGMDSFASATFFSTSVTLHGNSKGVGSPVDIPVGSHVYPFKLLLPTTLPPSFKSLRGENGYYFNAAMDSDSCIRNFQVLPYPVSAAADQILFASTLAKGCPLLTLEGPNTAYVGQGYTFKAKIENTGSQEIASFHVALKYVTCHYAYFGGTAMVRVANKPTDIAAIEVKNIAVNPGSSWSGEITLPIPKGLTTSLHSSISPLIQNEYVVEFKVLAPGKVTIECAGENRYSIVMASRNVEFEHVPLPTPSHLKPGTLYMRPVTDEFYASLVPEYIAPNTDHPDQADVETWPCRVNPALLADATAPEQFVTVAERGKIPDTDWWPGRKPSFYVDEPLPTDQVSDKFLPPPAKNPAEPSSSDFN